MKARVLVESKRVVVLGAGGFLGSCMTRRLAAQGHQVVAYWRSPSPEVEELSNVISVVGDLRDPWTLAEALRGAEVVYHFASATHPSLNFSDPAAEYREALQPLLVLMDGARHHGVRKVVFPSSGGTVYGDSDQPRTEESPTDPRSPYAVFKIAAEQLLHQAARQGHFAVDVFRIGNPFGPGQRVRPGQGVLPHWIAALQEGKPICVFGDGSARRDYVFIDDVCRLMSISCERLDQSGTYNLGTGTATSLSELVAMIRQLVPLHAKVEHLPGRASDIESISLSPRRLLSIAPGFRFTPLEDGLRQTLKHHELISDPAILQHPAVEQIGLRKSA